MLNTRIVSEFSDIFPELVLRPSNYMCNSDNGHYCFVILLVLITIPSIILYLFHLSFSFQILMTQKRKATMSDTLPESLNDQQFIPQLVYFGDEHPPNLADILLRLRASSKSNEHRHLASFLDECTRIMRDEFFDLPTSSKKFAPPFENILDLGRDESLLSGPLGLGVEYMLLCVIEIAALIGCVCIFPLGSC